MNVDLTTTGAVALMNALHAEYPGDWEMHAVPPTANQAGLVFRVFVGNVETQHVLTLVADGTWLLNSEVRP